MDKKRLILVVIFSVAAGLIISSKLNRIAKTKAEAPELNIKSQAISQENATNNAPDRVQDNTAPVNGDDKPKQASNYLTLIPECLSIALTDNISLKNISDQQKWMNKKPSNLIRQNLIYKNDSKEFRISITPSETSKTWTLQSFDVDSEGMPLPKNKVMGLQYEQLADKIKSEQAGLPLISDEQNILVDTPGSSGSILFINDEPTEIKLFNKKNQRLLECQGTYCVCSQALSS